MSRTTKNDSQGLAVCWRIVGHLADAKRRALLQGTQSDYNDLEAARTTVLHCKRKVWDASEAARKTRQQESIRQRLLSRRAA